MKKIIIGLVPLIVISSVVIFGQIDNPLQTKTTNTGIQCSSEINGLIYCIESPVVSIKYGQSIPIVIKIKNLTENEITLSNSSLESSFSLNLKNSDGMRIKSYSEKLKEKQQAGKAKEKDLIAALPINLGRSSTVISPNKEIIKTYNIENMYNLKNKGRYNLQMLKKDLDNETLIGNIPIIIK